MKLIILILLALATVTLVACQRRVGERYTTEEDNNKIIYHEIIHRILNDPEFLGLDARKQLQVLIAIYDIFNGDYREN